uniref:Uncharacterized protein n=1 Tax=Arundo donax TaxID=35708 RepID=A0A0A8YIH4_ARUDO
MQSQHLLASIHPPTPNLGSSVLRLTPCACRASKLDGEENGDVEGWRPCSLCGWVRGCWGRWTGGPPVSTEML